MSSFMLAEMSDKTTLATVTLASEHDWAGVWIGSTLGMVLADGLAIAVGVLLHQRLPARLLHSLASLLFLMFGLWMLFDSALGWRSVAVAATAAVALTAATLAAQRGGGAARRSPEGHRTRLGCRCTPHGLLAAPAHGLQDSKEDLGRGTALLSPVAAQPPRHALPAAARRARTADVSRRRISSGAFFG